MRYFEASFKTLVPVTDLAELHRGLKQLQNETDQLLLKIESIAKTRELHLSADEEIKPPKEE